MEAGGGSFRCLNAWMEFIETKMCSPRFSGVGAGSPWACAGGGTGRLRVLSSASSWCGQLSTALSLRRWSREEETSVPVSISQMSFEAF